MDTRHAHGDECKARSTGMGGTGGGAVFGALGRIWRGAGCEDARSAVLGARRRACSAGHRQRRCEHVTFLPNPSNDARAMGDAFERLGCVFRSKALTESGAAGWGISGEGECA